MKRETCWRAWENWTPGNAVDIGDTASAVIRMADEIETPVNRDIVCFTTTYTSSRWDRPRLSHSTLRFLSTDVLSSFLADACLVVEEQYGDWLRNPLDEASPEIITVAGRG